MSTEDAVINDPWSVFAEPIEGEFPQSSQSTGSAETSLAQLWKSRRRVSDGKWRWMCDVCDVVDAGYDTHLGDSLNSLIVNFRFMASEYSIRLRPSRDFPESAPEVDSTLGAAFEIDWNENATLLSTCSEFAEHCSLLDTAVVECSEVEYPFKFVEWKIHPEEADCIMVEMDFMDDESKLEARLTFAVEWRSPRSLPRSIQCSEPNLLRAVSFDRWDPTLTFMENLECLFIKHEDESEMP
ncbi:hypothetical protein Tcan_06097 [Toxocara canis]|uniref:Uncharacterized protein n=1 Tax=Toxocara canis TaxID=6265 RepID=A0A0B2V9D0_TOXCA|nr:hypothetical protein Tcan_06097 [Toxocara canis]